MSRSGNVWDHAEMESFLSSLKPERTGFWTYRTRDKAKADMFDYAEVLQYLANAFDARIFQPDGVRNAPSSA